MPTLPAVFAAAALGLAGLLAPQGAAGQAMPVPIARFFEPASLSDASLSPDGRALAMRLAAPGGKARLAVLDLASMLPTVVADFKDADVGHFQWLNQRRLVFDLQQSLIGPGRVEMGSGLFAVDADGQGFRQLVETISSFAKAQSDGGAEPLRWDTWLLGVPQALQGDEVLVVTPEERSKERIGHFQVQRLNTRTGRATPVEAPLHASHWVFDQQGALRAAQTSHQGRLGQHWRSADGAWRQLAERDRFDAGWTPANIGPDGTLYVQAAHQGHGALFTLDPATGTLADKPLASVAGFDVRPQFISSDTTLLGLRYAIDAEITQWLDPAMGTLQARVDALLPATANRLGLPARGDSPFVLVQSFADVQPMLTHVLHTGTGKLSRVGASRPGINPALMGQTDFVRYPAADGLMIPAYITLPPGVKADGAKKNLPLVVLVHGGPWVRGAVWQWQAEVQFLASRGYAVLQPEFRGSTGFGTKHFEAGFRQWGQAMQTDLADGARWAIAQGFADPQRIAIAGASYGGYATLMGLAQAPELFRVGISWVGVTDPALLFSVGWSDITNEAKQYGMARLIGDPVADADKLKAASPLALADRIKAPLLLAHGAWDVRVPLVHGEKFRDANRPHNPQLEWLLYPDEGHGWHKPQTEIDFWGRVERFLARHLAPR